MIIIIQKSLIFCSQNFAVHHIQFHLCKAISGGVYCLRDKRRDYPQPTTVLL